MGQPSSHRAGERKHSCTNLVVAIQMNHCVDNQSSPAYSPTKGRLRGQDMHPLSCNKHTRLFPTAKHSRCTSFYPCFFVARLDASRNAQGSNVSPTRHGAYHGEVPSWEQNASLSVGIEREQPTSFIGRYLFRKPKIGEGWTRLVDGLDIAWNNKTTVLCSNGQKRELQSREGSDVGKDANGMETFKRRQAYFFLVPQAQPRERCPSVPHEMSMHFTSTKFVTGT